MVEEVKLSNTEVKDFKKKYKPYIAMILFLACLVFAGYKMYLIKDLMREDLISNVNEYKVGEYTNDVVITNSKVYTAIWHVIDLVIALFIGGLIYANNRKVNER